MTSQPHTKNSLNNATSPLRVVPPPPTAEPAPAPNLPETMVGVSPPKETDRTKNNSTSFPYKHLFGIGIIVIGLGLISQIPVANSVNAEAQLEPEPESHQIVYTEVSGTLTELLVQPNQKVQANQAIAIISTEDMDVDIAQSQAEFDEAMSNYKTRTLQLNTLSAKVNEISVKESLITQQIQELQQELSHLPEVEKLNQEIAALQSTITGVRSQIAGRTETLARTQERISRYQDLVTQGVLALNILEDMQDRESNLITEISTLESEIDQLEQQIAAKQAEVKIVINKKQAELVDLQNELHTLTASRQTATVEFSAARKGVTSQEPFLNTLKTELERRQTTQQTHQILKAKQTGFIITPDFHKLLGRKMPAGEPILEIADLSHLVAIIEVPQTDSDIVKDGAKVTFRPLEPGLPSYTTQLEEIEPVMQPDPTQQKQLLKVRALINNSEQRLIPGAKVYASIESEKMPLYQKVKRELIKLFKFRKYGWGN